MPKICDFSLTVYIEKTRGDGLQGASAPRALAAIGARRRPSWPFWTGISRGCGRWP